ncbi:hypothetical protein [Muricauda brasiliensis]|uniref:hypothetical protein n=1 Tax=Muricauda brasiliensis TaxID=2162892 RepID=UPI000D3A15C9|nr:hypothetical protein [Muricauda brasiliensis]
MIDYVKIKVIDCEVDKLINHPLLEFHRSVSERTGELGTFTEASYHKCKIKVYDSGRVIFSGSIHKMYNSIKGIEAPNKHPKGFNGNQFHFQDIIEIRKHLCSLFNVPQKSLEFHNIEFGLNLHPFFNPQDFITWLLMFQGKEFQLIHDRHYAESKHQQYRIKIYNKGVQYGMPFFVIRLEIGVLKMIHQSREVGVRTMADINLTTINLAFEYLKKQLEKILYYDITINPKNLSKKQKGCIKDYKNDKYWFELEPKKRRRETKKLNALIESKSKNLKSKILHLLDKNRAQFNRLSETLTREEFNHSNIGLNNTSLKDRTCPVTGIDISMQKQGSKLLSNTGLKYLEKTNLKEFKKLQHILLTGQYNKFERSVYDRMSKQIRNKYFNNRSSFLSPVLFDS